jgi:hypothetical protein
MWVVAFFLELQDTIVIGHYIAALLFSIIFGFVTAFILGIAYYRFKWLDEREEDRPDIKAYELLAGSQLGFHIIIEMLLPSRRFYLFLGFCCIFWFLLFVVVILTS